MPSSTFDRLLAVFAFIGVISGLLGGYYWTEIGAAFDTDTEASATNETVLVAETFDATTTTLPAPIVVGTTKPVGTVANRSGYIWRTEVRTETRTVHGKVIEVPVRVDVPYSVNVPLPPVPPASTPVAAVPRTVPPMSGVAPPAVLPPAATQPVENSTINIVPVPEAVPDATTGPVLGPVPDVAPERVPDTTPEPVPDTAPAPVPDTTPGIAPETTPALTCPPNCHSQVEPGYAPPGVTD